MLCLRKLVTASHEGFGCFTLDVFTLSVQSKEGLRSVFPQVFSADSQPTVRHKSADGEVFMADS